MLGGQIEQITANYVTGICKIDYISNLRHARTFKDTSEWRVYQVGKSDRNQRLVTSMARP